MKKAHTAPLLIYDGDCDICLQWVKYWQQLAGGNMEIQSYQSAATDYPDIAVDEFRQAIKFIDAKGQIFSGAGAAFAIYKDTGTCALPDWLYRNIPGVRQISETAYKFFAGHRKLLAFLTYFLWGRQLSLPEYTLVTSLFLRLLGIIYFFAFFSLSLQILGLVGSEGILPLKPLFAHLQQQYGQTAFWHSPGLFWFTQSDTALQLSCYLGMALSLMLVVACFQATCLTLLYLLYLSLFYAGQGFMSFQWDLLLLESGFLAIFLQTGSPLARWLFRWLVFRFMLLGGLVKIISRDPNWDNLTALFYHFETQPLPTVFAWYAHQLPSTVLMAGTIFTFVTELILPFLIFFPRRLRMFAGCVFIIFQLLIFFTGNYNFFNLLTICLCLFLFDDAALRKCLTPSVSAWLIRQAAHKQTKWLQLATLPLAVLILTSSIGQMAYLFYEKQSPALTISQLIAPLRIVQNYGPFAVMTTQRNEIAIEATQDNINWYEYDFKYKPGAATRMPVWVAPHQPRLDWQMWFAALSPVEYQPWFNNLLYRLLTDSASVKALFARAPFTGPPVAVRARIYRYEFTTLTEKQTNGLWWSRQLLGDYAPAVRLPPSAAN